MLALARMGAIILPPMPAFYTRPRTIEDVVDQVVGRVLDHLGVDAELGKRWTGVADVPPDPAERGGTGNEQTR
jgi:3-polyprenyl-4-hydroxybenzoate decarboxylase